MKCLLTKFAAALPACRMQDAQMQDATPSACGLAKQKAPEPAQGLLLVLGRLPVRGGQRQAGFLAVVPP